MLDVDGELSYTGEMMKAGRELDALVAEKVMGCKVLWQAATVSGPYCGCLCDNGFREGPHSDPNGLDENLKDYSTDIAAAWEVVEKANLLSIGRMDACLTFVREPRWKGDPQFNHWCIGSWDQDGAFDCQASAPTVPLAICLAALNKVSIATE